MAAGKDYFTDKTPFTTLAQLDAAKAAVARTGRKYMVYFSERLHVESAMYATDLVAGAEPSAGSSGSSASGPTGSARRAARPGFSSGPNTAESDRHRQSSVRTVPRLHRRDGCHRHAGGGRQLRQSGQTRVRGFWRASLLGDNGTPNYIRVDWFTPDGLATWGDGRTVILGTKGYIELRKYVDVARESEATRSTSWTTRGERYLSVAGQVGFRSGS